MLSLYNNSTLVLVKLYYNYLLIPTIAFYVMHAINLLKLAIQLYDFQTQLEDYVLLLGNIWFLVTIFMAVASYS